MKRFTFFLLIFLCLNWNLELHAKPASGVSATLSVVPGLGQTANGNPMEGLGWFTLTVGGFLFAPSFQTVFLDLWMYNIYDAYKDAGAKRTAKYNVYQNWISAFNPTLIWGPYSTVPLAWQTAVAVGGSGRPSFAIGPNSPFLSPFYMSFVALGEEALFRGFVYPAFMDMTGGSVFISSLVSSMVFAAAHGVYSGQSSYAFQPYVFGLRTALGIFYCLQTEKDKYDLRKSIFSHTWFDVIYEWDRQGIFGGGHIGDRQARIPTGVKGVFQFQF